LTSPRTELKRRVPMQGSRVRHEGEVARRSRYPRFSGLPPREPPKATRVASASVNPHSSHDWIGASSPALGSERDRQDQRPASSSRYPSGHEVSLATPGSGGSPAGRSRKGVTCSDALAAVRVSPAGRRRTRTRIAAAFADGRSPAGMATCVPAPTKQSILKR
jgi:hypothetical protein